MNARMRGSSSINRIRIDRRRRVLAGNVDFRFGNVAFRLRTALFPLRVAEADRRKAVVRGTISALSQVVAGHELTAADALVSGRKARRRRQRAHLRGGARTRAGGRLGPQIFCRRRSVRQLRSPPVERDDPHREFERASIERLSELGDSYEIVP